MVDTATLRFCFELDETQDVQAWGESGRKSLHWFGLTSGRFWIETPAGELLRYTPEVRTLWNYPFDYVDYQVARLFEDLQSCLSAALEPVPEDIALLVANSAWLDSVHSWREEECDQSEVDSRWNLYESAVSWWHEREIDTGYLSHGPWFSIWCTGDLVHFRWTTRNNQDRGVPIFLVPSGYFSMTLAEFKSAACGFCETVLATMSVRVEHIKRHGWTRTDCEIDVGALLSEQRQRENQFSILKNRTSATNWDEIRLHLKLLVARVNS